MEDNCIEGNLEVKLPTRWTDGKAEVGRVKEEKKRKWEDQRRERERRKKMQVREKVGKSRFTVFFPMICGSGGSKSRLAKAAGAEPCCQIRDEKLHAFVTQSTFPSQKVESTPGSDHFFKLSRRKSACRCGAKHISKFKVSKTHGFGPPLEVQMSNKCTPLWSKAHFQVNMYKAHHVETTFESWNVRKVHAVVTRNTFP